MPVTSLRLVAGSVAVVIALVVAFGSVAAFYNRAPNVADPEAPFEVNSAHEIGSTESGIPDIPIVPPRLVLSDLSTFDDAASNEAITAPDGRPVAQLASPPASLNRSLGVHFSELLEIPSDVLAFTILASVRYEGDNTVLVTTSRQSGPEEQPILLGSETVMLENDSKAWASTNAQGFPDAPNQLVLVRDGLIITLSSDLSTDELAALAADVIITSAE